MDQALSSLYGGEYTADVVLVVREETRQPCCDGEDSQPAAKRQKTDEALDSDTIDAVSATMLAHKAVLWRLSEYFQSKIKNWSSDSSNEKPEIVILVPAGQLEVGKTLVVAMYDQIPKDISQQQLLQLLTLAESYRIDRVASAVVSKLSSMPTAQLQWETVLAIHQLPAAEALYGPLKAAATTRLLQVMGDLELIWALEQPHQKELLQQQLNKARAAARECMCGVSSDQSDPTAKAIVAAGDRAVAALKIAALHKWQPLHTLLLQLPFGLLLELITSANCRVASEDTVHYTISRWMNQHPEATVEQCRQLAEQVQLRFCTPSYLLHEVCDEDNWLSGLLPTHHLIRQTALCVQPETLQGLMHYSFKCSQQRARDTVLQRLQLSWNVPLTDIRDTYHEGVQEAYGSPSLSQEEHFAWQGRLFHLRIEMSLTDEDVDDPGIPLGWINSVSIRLDMERDVAIDPGTYYSVKFTAWGQPAADGAATEALQRTCGRAAKQQFSGHVSEQLFLMYSDLEVRGDNLEAAQRRARSEVCHDWQQLEAALMRQGLVHADGCLHLTAEVWDMC